MGNLTLQGSTSGQITLAPTAVAGTNTLTLPAVTGTVLASSSGTITVPSGSGTAAVQGLSTNIVSGTAQATTSGTAILFTGIPSYAKRVTVMFQGVSQNGSANKLIQLGNGSIVTSGYVCTYGYATTSLSNTTATNGFQIPYGGLTTEVVYGSLVFNLITGNTWVCSSFLGSQGGGQPGSFYTSGYIALGSSLDRVNITTVGAAGTFTAGNINIMYE